MGLILDAGRCQFCEQGQKRLVQCPDCGVILALCDECEAMWLDPADDVLPVFPQQPDLPCPFCGSGAGWSHWVPIQPGQLVGTRWEVLIARSNPSESSLGNDESNEPPPQSDG